MPHKVSVLGRRCPSDASCCFCGAQGIDRACCTIHTAGQASDRIQVAIKRAAEHRWIGGSCPSTAALGERHPSDDVALIELVIAMEGKLVRYVVRYNDAKVRRWVPIGNIDE